MKYNYSEMCAIERWDDVTIYGKINPTTKRVGGYQVYSIHLGDNGEVYTFLYQAQERMRKLIGVQNIIAKTISNQSK